MTFTELGSGNSRGLICAFMEHSRHQTSPTIKCRPIAPEEYAPERKTLMPGTQFDRMQRPVSPQRLACITDPTGAPFPNAFWGLDTMTAIGQDSVRQRWSTWDVEPRRALAYWIDTICQAFLEIDIESRNGPHFSARLDRTDFGAANLYRVEADAQTVRRTPARISRSQDAYCFLMQLRHGEIQYRQYGPGCRIGPGACLLVDSKHPHHPRVLRST